MPVTLVHNVSVIQSKIPVTLVLSVSVIWSKVYVTLVYIIETKQKPFNPLALHVLVIQNKINVNPNTYFVSDSITISFNQILT